MRAVICAIAKMEENYIKDWCEWHLNLGFSDIYIYDNNDEGYQPTIESCLPENILSKVHITKVPGEIKDFQRTMYTNFYNQNKTTFDWCAFIDVDEFINLRDWSNITEFLSDEKFKDAEIIQLEWHLFGDNNEIKQDISVPIYNRITQEACHPTNWRKQQGKSIVCGNLNDIYFVSSHCPYKKNKEIPIRYMVDGSFIKTAPLHSVDKHYESAYIAHYMTKTLDEYINQKFLRVENNGYSNSFLAPNVQGKNRFKYFFKLNQKTPEKIEYIKNILGIDV